MPVVAAALAAVVYKSVIKGEKLSKTKEEKEAAKAEKMAAKEARKKAKDEMKGKKAGTLGEFGNNPEQGEK